MSRKKPPQPGSNLLAALTHSDVAVRLDFIDPEAFLNQGARSAEQLFELPEGERSHLHHSHSASTRVFTHSMHVGKIARHQDVKSIIRMNTVFVCFLLQNYAVSV